MTTIINRHQGWNAGARSIKRVEGDAELTVEPFDNVTGASVGFSAGTDVTSLIEQTHAFLFTLTPLGGSAAIYERSVLKQTLGAYVEGDLFKIRRVEGEVTYWKNGTLVYTSLTQSTGPAYLAAALYLGGDRV